MHPHVHSQIHRHIYTNTHLQTQIFLSHIHAHTRKYKNKMRYHHSRTCRWRNERVHTPVDAVYESVRVRVRICLRLFVCVCACANMTYASRQVHAHVMGMTCASTHRRIQRVSREQNARQTECGTGPLGQDLSEDYVWGRKKMHLFEQATRCTWSSIFNHATRCASSSTHPQNTQDYSNSITNIIHETLKRLGICIRKLSTFSPAHVCMFGVRPPRATWSSELPPHLFLVCSGEFLLFSSALAIVAVSSRFSHFDAFLF